MSKLSVSIVTPESTTFDRTADSVVVPLFDGEAGILAGHAPMIGRLAPGELRVTAGSEVFRFYVDGGFVQVQDNRVSVITGRSLSPDKIDVAAAQKTLDEVQIKANDKFDMVELKTRTISQARAQLRIAQRG